MVVFNVHKPSMNDKKAWKTREVIKHFRLVVSFFFCQLDATQPIFAVAIRQKQFCAIKLAQSRFFGDLSWNLRSAKHTRFHTKTVEGTKIVWVVVMHY